MSVTPTTQNAQRRSPAPGTWRARAPRRARFLVFEPGGRRIPALAKYPSRIRLACNGCTIDLATAAALDIHVHPDGTDAIFLCPRCDRVTSEAAP